MEAYRTWSRWEKVLFMSHVPDLDTLFTVDENGEISLHESLDKEIIKANDNLKRSPAIEFLLQFFKVVSLTETYKSLKPAFLNGHVIT